MRTTLLLLLSLVAFAGRPAGAQEVDLRAEVDAATGALVIQLGSLLDDDGLRQAIHSGLPIRVEVRGELWKDGFFDSEEGSAEWRASIIHDPIRRSYEVEIAGSAARRVATLDEAERILAGGFEMELGPTREGRYYYLARVQVQTLDLSDLAELRRWLRGDVAPAVGGETRGESAVANGLRRVLVRALGLPSLRRRLRTEAFDWGS